MIRIIAIGLVVATLCGCAQVVPSHEIRAKPEHIRAGVQVGDSIEVTTRDGQYREFEVTNVSVNTIEGPTETIPFSEITHLVKRSWKTPEHPCGGGKPVGCSIPEVVLVLSDVYKEQAEKFHPACVTHDFCYRHGFTTYGAKRDECDQAFYTNMKSACGGMAGLDRFDFKGYGICQLAARQTFEAVRRYGEPHYLATTGSYCEYR